MSILKDNPIPPVHTRAAIVHFIFGLTTLFSQYKKKKRIKTPPHSISTFIFTQSKHIKTF